ncbi:sigma 54-interacting transcriptional regulator [Archangium lansingense]|uniref:Sigma 54-interacting transcriptional regulator n=1 Tax=Archangium lansingense TaxID=2995310 RepID=A0ABT3ZWP0_9BACT|nr:sigma 54-interacting transcriptional regulator [Archangium lansinium]MCY1073812.1 sigma 54-interacting transcriptional regulator [Archangium lansinium]
MLLLDSVNPDVLEALRELSHSGSARVLAVVTTRDALAGDAAWHLLQAGASDVLAWCHSKAPVAEIAARLTRWLQVEQLIRAPLVQSRLVGTSRTWLSTLRQLVEVAAFTDSSVLLLGESGTGKEEAARLIHALDPRAGRRELVVLDCTTVVPELSGSEFFGHERGAFTGAVAARDGAFALADGGTLFLDEVGELPLGLQAQLLRAVQEHSYKRVGSNVWHQTEFRLICATNRDLTTEVLRGGFRRDFFHRIASWSCRLPPLRERPEDVLPLVHHFLKELRPGQEPPELDAPVRGYLLTRQYPGNVRDLRQLVTRISKRHVGPGPITVGDIPPDELPREAIPDGWQGHGFEQAIRRALVLGAGLKDIGRAATEVAIQMVIADEAGNLQRAARRLGVTDRALQLRRAQRDSRPAPANKPAVPAR